MLSRRLAVLAICGSLGLSIAVACSDDLPTSPTSDAATEDAVAPGDGLCPTVTPAQGETCALPMGTTCSFGCGAVIARCLAGSWVFSGNEATDPPCPKDFPVEGTACPACWAPDASCVYGSVDCTAPDASANTTVATCGTGLWVLTTTPCGILDAGPDVQGDAEPDAD